MRILVASFILVLTAAAGSAEARMPEAQNNYVQQASYERTPLLIIRFNQPRVYFERSLYMAVSQAAEAKDAVLFDFVSHVPAGANAGKANANLDKVLAVMDEMGVPRNRISVNQVTDNAIVSDEVHLFVR